MRLFYSRAARTIVRQHTRRRYVAFLQTDENIGGQFSRYMTVRNLAQYFHLTYIHQPFIPNRLDPSCNWESLLGLGLHKIQYQDIDKKSVETVFLPHFDLRYCCQLQKRLLHFIIQRIYPEGNVLFLCAGYQFWPPDNRSSYQSLKQEVISKYRLSRKHTPLKSVFRKGSLKVVMHVRRGELKTLIKNSNPQGTARWVPIQWYEHVVSNINSIFRNHRLDIHIFTDEKSSDEFDRIRVLPNVTMHFKNYDSQVVDLLHSSVLSDVVVCGLSGFSFMAGLLSRGVKLVPYAKNTEVYFPDNPEWIRIRGDEIMTERLFEYRLDRKGVVG